MLSRFIHIDIKNIILTSSLLISPVFFSIMSIIGIRHYGREAGNLFVIFSVTFFTMCLLIIFLNWFCNSVKFLFAHYIFMLFIPIAIMIIFFIQYSGNRYVLSMFQFYLSFSLVSSFIGLYYSTNRQEFNKSFNCWVIIMWLLSIGILVELLAHLFTVGYNLNLWRYQGLSYTASICYSLNLYFILFKNRIKIFRLCYKKIYRIASVLLLFFQIMCVFISGGRGGMVVVILSTLLIFSYSIKLNINRKAIVNVMTGLIVMFFLSFPILSNNEVIIRGASRLFNFITDTGIDITRTGRDGVYALAIYGIRERPILGHGIFGQFEFMNNNYPHNIFLEILLGGGVIYFLLSIFVFIIFFVKLNMLIEYDVKYMMLIPLTSYVFVFLSFSGSYIINGLFWFLVTLVFTLKIDNKLKIDNYV